MRSGLAARSVGCELVLVLESLLLLPLLGAVVLDDELLLSLDDGMLPWLWLCVELSGLAEVVLSVDDCAYAKLMAPTSAAADAAAVRDFERDI